MDLKNTMASERNQIHSYDILGKKDKIIGKENSPVVIKDYWEEMWPKRVTQGNCGEIVIEWFCILIALVLIQVYAFVKTHRTDYQEE